MNWYKRSLLKIAHIRGEYWIQGGVAYGADTEINDTGHEGMAIQAAQERIMDEGDDWEEWKQNVATEAFQEAMSQAITPQQKQEVQDKWDDDNGEEFLMQALRERGVDSKVYQLAEGYGDPRNLAMELWGWKILKGNQIQTWTITNEDLKDIADGVYDAYQEEAELATYEIEVMLTKKEFTAVLWDVISTGNSSLLLGYMYRRY